MKEEKVIRVPVDYDYAALNPEVMRRMAMIGQFAKEKYGAWEQFTHARLTGDKDPINHAFAHIWDYVMGKAYDRFDGGTEWNLVAAMYNLQMAFFNHQRFGFVPHPLVVGVETGPKFGGNPFPPGKIADLMAKEADEGLMPVKFGDHRDFIWPEEITEHREKKHAMETDWFHGVSYFEDRWVDGRNGARKPDTMMKFSAMIEAIGPLRDFRQDPPALLCELFQQRKIWWTRLEDSRTPEATMKAQSAIAALDTIRTKVPQMFPIEKEEGES